MAGLRLVTEAAELGVSYLDVRGVRYVRLSHIIDMVAWYEEHIPEKITDEQTQTVALAAVAMVREALEELAQP